MRCRKGKELLLILIAMVLSSAVLGCGKKGAPTLKSYEQPETPANLSVVHREGSMILQWAYPPARENLISQFIVLRAEGSAFEKLSPVDKGARSYIDKEIKNGNTYDYKVLSQNLRGVYSKDSAIASASPVEGPLPPTKLSYTVTGKTLALQWEHAQKGTLFNLYRSTEKGKYDMKPINPKPLSEPVYKDIFSVNGIFFYTVRGLTGSSIRDEGPASEELTVDAADLIPAMPGNLQAFPSAGSVILSWTEFDELWVTGFNVYRKIDNGNYRLLGRTQTPTFVDPEAPTSKRDYRVTATGMAKEGPAAEIKDIIYIPQR